MYGVCIIVYVYVYVFICVRISMITYGYICGCYRIVLDMGFFFSVFVSFFVDIYFGFFIDFIFCRIGIFCLVLLLFLVVYYVMLNFFNIGYRFFRIFLVIR